MAVLTKYKIWCNTEQLYRFVTQATPPTECPISSEHNVDLHKVSIVETNIYENAVECIVCLSCTLAFSDTSIMDDHIEEFPSHIVLNGYKHKDGDGMLESLSVKRDDGTRKKIKIDDADTIYIV